MPVDNIRDMLLREEGKRNSAYNDTLGIPTIGVGHTGPEVHLGLVWTDDQVNAALDADILSAHNEVSIKFPWIIDLSQSRQAVLIGMCFQMGLHGLSGFPKMLEACEYGDYEDAANEMRDSLWHKQTPARVERMATQLESGEWV